MLRLCWFSAKLLPSVYSVCAEKSCQNFNELFFSKFSSFLDCKCNNSNKEHLKVLRFFLANGVLVWLSLLSNAWFLLGDSLLLSIAMLFWFSDKAILLDKIFCCLGVRLFLYCKFSLCSPSIVREPNTLIGTSLNSSVPLETLCLASDLLVSSLSWTCWLSLEGSWRWTGWQSSGSMFMYFGILTWRSFLTSLYLCGHIRNGISTLECFIR